MASSESLWQSTAFKAAIGVVAVAALGFAAWQLAKEDEVENVRPAVKKRIGKLQYEYKGQHEVVELHQLLKIMTMINELTK